jgi:plasmid stabilization system protein ParE
MDFKVIWSDAAIADLRELCSYIAKNDPEAANRMGVAFLITFAFLVPIPSLALHIREAREVPCAK